VSTTEATQTVADALKINTQNLVGFRQLRSAALIPTGGSGSVPIR